jgi:thymidylate synthase
MNQLDLDYQNLLRDILDNGVEKNTRNGQTISVFGRSIRYKFKDGKFPLLTTKKMYFKGICVELLWFLRGSTQGRELIKDDCHIWDGDMYANYIKEYDLHESGRVLSKKEFINRIKTDDEFANKWSDLGPLYGKQWRDWGEDTGVKIDQIQNLINDLKTNPDSRRLLVSAWNPADLSRQVLPPCHYGFQVYTRELSLEERQDLYEEKYMFTETIEEKGIDYKHNIPTRAISLMYNARSQDVPLGTPFNIASYALLLEILGKMVNMVPDELIANMGDCHIYKNQIDGVKEQLTKEPYPLPKLGVSNNINFDGTIDDFVNSCSKSDFKIEDYQSHPTIKIPLSN